MHDAYLVFLETFSNQRYIFATNKLREHVGASELTFRAGTQWILYAVDGAHREDAPLTAEQVRERLLSPIENPPLEQQGEDGVEVIYLISGKALLLVGEQERARALVTDVTTRVLEQAPGLEMLGAVQPVRWDPAASAACSDAHLGLHRAIGEATGRQARLRSELPGPETRFLHQPLVAACTSSGLPATHLWSMRRRSGTSSDAREPLATAARAKLRAADEGLRRLRSYAPDSHGFVGTLDELDDRLEGQRFVAVAHADGNGVGGVFGEFDRHLGQALGTTPSNRDYITALRQFSLGLDIVTVSAFRDAVDLAFSRHRPTNGDGASPRLPVLPVILGGDDLTVVCAGDDALAFTIGYLRRFLHHSAQPHAELGEASGIVAKIAQAALGAPKLAACAGVALTKPHFPFFESYGLVEELTKSAKTVKQFVYGNGHGGQRRALPCAAFDVHVLFDSSDASLARIREALSLAEDPSLSSGERRTTMLTARPYLVAGEDAVKGEANPEVRAWCEERWIQRLGAAVAALRAQDPSDTTRKALPTGQVQRLRRALFRGAARTDAELSLLLDRFGDALAPLLGGGAPAGPTSLFFDDTPPPGVAGQQPAPQRSTRLLDAIELRDFLPAPEQGLPGRRPVLRDEDPVTENGAN